HSYMVEQEMLSYASGLQGQSLIDNMGGKNAVRREAMGAFLYSAMYARNANNYELVMTSARHYWNACITLVSQPIERELLKEPIRTILDCITATAEKKPKKEDKDSVPVVTDTKSDKSLVQTEGKAETKDVKEVKEQKSSTMIGSPQEDLTLRAALYGVLFMSYIDQEEWENALQAMDQAVDAMPRTKHRL
ncbi:cilia- and flagella-associated protein 46-like, partial [Gigantopelta aegis]|uniref:cilia- and flagella-associated protein 46-like n=1 Tax=Gigantopelta aegis TaxID=1735272 RepID=UPI001B8891CD